MLNTAISIRDEHFPLLATAIHHGHQLPLELLAICGIDEAGRLREEDPYTGEIAELFPNNVIVHTSRFAIDLNRPPHKAVYLRPEDCWGLPVRSKPVPQELQDQLRQDYASWYSLISYQIGRLLSLHSFLIVLDLHSYNHRRGGPQAQPDPQEKNPDIIIGRGNLLKKHYPAAQALTDLLNGQKLRDGTLDCRQDIKFTGGQFSRWLNSQYPERLLCLAVEFKKTFMDEWTGTLDRPAFDNLKRLFAEAVSLWHKQFI